MACLLRHGTQQRMSRPLGAPILFFLIALLSPPHAPTAEFLEDAVVRNGLAQTGRRIGHVRPS